MLARVNDLVTMRIANGPVDDRHLDELGPSPDDRRH